MIQRWNINYDMEGEFYLCAHIDPLIEWRDLSKVIPKFFKDVLIWRKGWNEPIIAFLEDDKEFGIIFEWNGDIHEIEGEPYKWKNIEPNPWTTK